MNDDHRTDATLTGTEREQLESFLHHNRSEIIGLLDGLSARHPDAADRLIHDRRNRPMVLKRKRHEGLHHERVCR